MSIVKLQISQDSRDDSGCQLSILIFVIAYVEHIFMDLGKEVTLACLLFMGKLADTGCVVDVRWALLSSWKEWGGIIV